MGSSDAMRKLELVMMQCQSQVEWAEQAILTAMDGVAHFTKLANSYGSDCQEAMRARASALTLERAIPIFSEVLASCEKTITDCEKELAA
jgi:hypothetical protein